MLFQLGTKKLFREINLSSRGRKLATTFVVLENYNSLNVERISNSIVCYSSGHWFQRLHFPSGGGTKPSFNKFTVLLYSSTLPNDLRNFTFNASLFHPINTPRIKILYVVYKSIANETREKCRFEFFANETLVLFKKKKSEESRWL